MQIALLKVAVFKRPQNAVWGIFSTEEVHASGEQWGLNLSHQDFPKTLPQFFLPKNPPLDQKLKVDLFKGCLSADTFLGFITFP